MASDIKINKILRENVTHMNMLGEILKPEVLHAHVPRLASIAEARVEYRNKMNTLQALGATSRATGFDPTRQFQYVAQIDQAIWSAVLEVFAKYEFENADDPNSPPRLMHDGLLYVTDHRGNVVLNRPFFYALLAGPLKDYDMRGKVKLN
jgi:hypothetical protein